MRKFLIKLTGLAILAIVVLGIPEIVLRLFPVLIAVPVLERMHPELRSEIATRLNLPTAEDYTTITSSQRTDGGPDILLMRPNRSYYRPVDSIDRAAGAVDTTHTDNRGFCNSVDFASQPFVDIVTVGGSVPNCASVDGDAVFSAQLGNLLAVSSYNLTVHAVGPYEYNEVLRRFVDELKPRVVVFAISEANDLRDCMRYLDHVADRSGGRHRKLGGPFKFSYVLAFIKAGIEVLAKEVSAATRPNFRYSVKVQHESVAMNNTNGDIDELESARKLRERTLRADLYASPLKTFVTLAHEKNFAPIVLYVPAAYTVFQPSVIFEDSSIAEIMKYYSQVQRQWLAENAGILGYEFMDPTDFLQRVAESGPLLYFPSDMHWTAEGHKALAQAVADRIGASLAASKRLN